jgi:hypothetical protein
MDARSEVYRSLTHRCDEPLCPHFGQATSRSCNCHVSREDMAIERILELENALETALPRIAHKAECHRVRPSAEWAEHGSASFDNCSCEISVVRAALKGVEPSAKPKDHP